MGFRILTEAEPRVEPLLCNPNRLFRHLLGTAVDLKGHIQGLDCSFARSLELVWLIRFHCLAKAAARQRSVRTGRGFMMTPSWRHELLRANPNNSVPKANQNREGGFRH